MSTPPDDLFELIKTLSKTEKRYFSVEAQKGNKGANDVNTQLILFDILKSLEEYDEEKVKKQLYRKLGRGPKTDKFINRLALEKLHLYQAILKEIRNYNSKSSDYIQLKDALIDAKHLLEKGLYSQSAKLLRKAKRIATEYHNQLALLEINRAERSLVLSLNKRHISREMHQLLSEKEEVLQYLNTELVYQDYYDRLCLEMVKHHKLTQAQIDQINHHFHSFIFNEDQEKKTPFAQLRHIQMKGFFYLLAGEQEPFYQTLVEEYQWWEKYPQYKKEDFFRYKISLHNYLLANYRRKKFDVALKIIKTLEQKAVLSSFEKRMIFDFKCTIEILIYLNTTQLAKAKKLIPEIKKGFRTYSITPYKRSSIINNIGILYFLAEDFTESISWLLQLLQGHNTGNREDIRIFGSLLLAICYFETGDITRMDNSFRSIYRTISENKQIGTQDLEYAILDHLKRITKAPLFDQPTALAEFKNELQRIKDQAGNNKSLPFLDEFIVWSKSRLSKRPMEEVLKEENEKNTN